MKKLILFIAFNSILLSNCSYFSILDIYKNDKLIYNVNYIYKEHYKLCDKLEEYTSNGFIKKGHKINLKQLNNLKEEVIIDFGNNIFFVFDKSELVEVQRTSIKIKNKNKIKKIKFKQNIRN